MKLDPRLVLGLTWLVAFNLRTGFIGVGPVLPDLADDLLLSNTVASLLVAIPTLMMGLVAIPGGFLADRFGSTLVITTGLAFVALGGGLRALATGWAPLLLFTVLFGAGIGIAQPPLPRLIRGLYPRRIGLATGIYSSGMVIGSILAGSFSGPLLTRLPNNAGWRGALLLWAVVAAISFVIWVACIRPWRWRGPVLTVVQEPASAEADRSWKPTRDRRIWIIALLFAAQGLGYYLLIAWLPSVYHELGLNPDQTSVAFAIYNASTLPGILGVPALSDRLRSRRLPSLLASLTFAVGSLGLIFSPLAPVHGWLWAGMCGFGVAGLFGMTLVLPTDVAPAARTGAAAGLVLGVGYAGSALGPVLAGLVRDVTGGFTVALATLPLLGLVMALLSLMLPNWPPSAAKSSASPAPMHNE